jgi:4-diphosphocytidyl-2-C-methyl-D-erythritol kinase
MVKLIAQRTPAKINLFLRVTGRRPDGYHELDSVFVPISLYDAIRLELRASEAGSVTLTCDSESLPRDERNLAVRAACEFMKEFGAHGEVSIDLRKQIPVGAGLGGGSSDAAAVLRMMAALSRTADAKRLGALALRLGADVPFFLDPRPARVGGIGEKIAHLSGVPKLNLLIAVPPCEVSTAAVFGGLKREGWSGPAPEEHLRALAAGEVSASMLVNDLAAVASRRYPEVAALKALLEDLGARAAQMTGSGGAVFGIFDGPEGAARACEKARMRLPRARFLTVSSLN